MNFIKNKLIKLFKFLEDVFKKWLAPHSELNKVVCTAYSASIACHKTDLLRHSQTVKYTG